MINQPKFINIIDLKNIISLFCIIHPKVFLGVDLEKYSPESA